MALQQLVRRKLHRESGAPKGKLWALRSYTLTAFERVLVHSNVYTPARAHVCVGVCVGGYGETEEKRRDGRKWGIRAETKEKRKGKGRETRDGSVSIELESKALFVSRRITGAKGDM